ncbi:hypothetical protein EMCG_06308 [[Emmonsia] crescens]|uniref:HMG box domain-containing protein n=1 Tax=[Emmonsia] crescens TaxID=73230 RepID=A0A0G2IBD6_9EURO|nr:hypothetical protein EMCG_06308 [Emmonsia crescens UAMH 3008]
MLNTHPPSPPLSIDGEITPNLSNCSIQTAGSPYLQSKLQVGSMYMQIAAQSPALQYTRLEMDPNGQPRIVGDYGIPGPYRNGDEVVYPQMGPLCTPQLPLHPLNRSASPPASSRINKARVRRTARMRKRNTAKRGNNDGITLKRPLSELTREIPIPVRDMELHVKRSSEQRLKETERKKGKIPRPMNSFMLYRSAYAEVTKEWCCQNNHQVVSQLAGKSWPLEPQEIRDHYERLANIERDNHDKAHPNYKFAPNKSTNTPKKKKKALSLKEEENSDINDPDFTMPSYPNPARQMSSAPFPDGSFLSRAPTPMDRDSSYDSRQGTPFEQCGDIYLNGDMNRSSWQMSNPGRPLPGMTSSPEQTHYYQPSIHQSMLGPNIEDVTFKKMGVPGIQYDGPGTLAGLPGNAHPDLLQQQPLPQARTPVSLNDLQVDPQLLEFDSQPSLPSNDATNYDGQLDVWRIPNGEQHYVRTSIPSQEEERYISQSSFHPGMQQPMDGREMWNENQIDAGGEFDDWISTGTPFEYGNGQQKHL